MADLLRRRLGIVVVAAVIVLVLSSTRIASFLTDLWWFDALGFREIFTGILFTQIGLGVAFGLAIAALIAVNLLVARRLKPVVLPSSEREAMIERYRQMADPYVPWIVAGVAALFAVSAGGAAATQWDRFLLWRHGGPFGMDDPLFGRDIGYYVFELPWLSFVQGWLFTALLLTLLVTAAAHYLLGAIRPELPRDRVTPRAKIHLSVLLALVLGAHGWGYWLDRFHLNFSPRGTVTGAAYTDVHAELPALHLLLGITALAIVLVVWNVRQRGWLLPGAALGLLVLASIILQGIYPAAIQRLRVDPQELAREHEYIGHNLDATRFAYGLDEVAGLDGRFPVHNDLSEEDLEEHAVTIQNVRLWDPDILETTYKQLQAIRPYYDFSDVDVDRYEIDGELRQVMIAVRELSTTGLAEIGADTWQNIHLTYTQGYGAVASQVNLATGQGQPVLLARDIPPRPENPGADALIPDQPAVYFGETHRDYSIVRTEQREIEFEDSETDEVQWTAYDGEGGVAMGTFGRRLAFAVRYADPNIILSGLINSDSEIIFRRNVAERVNAVAPYLVLDNDPYAVVLDRRIVWVQDAYTTSAHFPYSERSLFHGQSTNYVRNSVKAVVDAYDGTVTLYVIDEEDPVLAAWREVFPGPYVPADEAPAQLERHFRYPQDIFALQAELYRTYHIQGIDEFYTKADAWDKPQDASAIANGAPASTMLDPYYLLMRLPGEEEEEFVLIQPYLARDRPVMIAWLAGRSDPGHHGDLYAVRFPGDQTILGPMQAQARIEQDPEISAWITLRERAGSQVIRGNMMIIPIERSILYVEPLFIQNPQAQIPELAQVAAVLGDSVIMQPTLDDSLGVLVGAVDPVDPIDGDPGAEDPGEGLDADELVVRAREHLAEANAALVRGDLAAYQRAIQRAEELLERWAELRGIDPGELDDEIPPDEGDFPPPDDGGTDAYRPRAGPI